MGLERKSTNKSVLSLSLMTKKTGEINCSHYRNVHLDVDNHNSRWISLNLHLERRARSKVELLQDAELIDLSLVQCVRRNYLSIGKALNKFSWILSCLIPFPLFQCCHPFTHIPLKNNTEPHPCRRPTNLYSLPPKRYLTSLPQPHHQHQHQQPPPSSSAASRAH